MQCPSCQHPESRVLESRPTEAGRSVRRRRECLQCQYRFTTYERVEVAPVAAIKIIKRDGKCELFDRDKLLRGMVLACEKTQVSTARLEAIVNAIEVDLQGRQEREVASSDVGALALQYLRAESSVAYIRFASVHQQFQDIRDFAATLDRLEDETGLRSDSR